MSDVANITRIKAVYRALDELGDSVVFVGGATVSFYKDKPATETRVTDDVDIVVEVVQYSSYVDIENQLRKKGFVNDIDSNIICRYKIQGIIVDVLPTEENVLGFKNKWYPAGFQNTILHSIGENESIRIFNAIYFLASKIDAYNDRGNGDGRTSSDFEDIVYVLNNRNAIWEEMQNADEQVKGFLKTEFKKLIEQDYLYEWISAHLDPNEQRRANFIVGGLMNFVNS